MKSRNIFKNQFKSILDCKTNKEIYNQADKPLYIQKVECNNPNWQGEWERVLQLRKEKQEKQERNFSCINTEELN